jgi:hypothetical protein
MVSRLEFPDGSRWANEMAALAAGLGPKWCQHFLSLRSLVRLYHRLRQK